MTKPSLTQIATRLNCHTDDLATRVLHRRADAAIGAVPEADEDGRVSIPITLSSETEGRQAFGEEVLSHADGAVDLSRLQDGRLPLLARHDQNGQWPIGYLDSFELKDRRLRAVANFASTPEAQTPLALMREGVPLSVSPGYRVDWDRAEEINDGRGVKFNRWQLMEGSVVPVAEDPTVGFNRSVSEVATMPDEERTPEVVDFDAAYSRARDEGAASGANHERERIMQIRAAFDLPSVPKSERMRALQRHAEEQVAP